MLPSTGTHHLPPVNSAKRRTIIQPSSSCNRYLRDAEPKRLYDHRQALPLLQLTRSSNGNRQPTAQIQRPSAPRAWAARGLVCVRDWQCNRQSWCRCALKTPRSWRWRTTAPKSNDRARSRSFPLPITNSPHTTSCCICIAPCKLPAFCRLPAQYQPDSVFGFCAVTGSVVQSLSERSREHEKLAGLVASSHILGRVGVFHSLIGGFSWGPFRGGIVL